jgi:hypothetical protein
MFSQWYVMTLSPVGHGENTNTRPQSTDDQNTEMPSDGLR